MSERVRGRVINVHVMGATVRLENGDLVSVPRAELERERPAYTRSLSAREDLVLERTGRTVALVRLSADERVAEAAHVEAPHSDERFEARMAEYLKQTEEWAPPDLPEPAQRHLFRKRQRARLFEPPNSTLP